MTDFFKKLEIYIDWKIPNNQQTQVEYQDAQIIKNPSFFKYKNLEKEVLSGVPLGQCLDLYRKKEKLDGY
jgi:hypothetical protein